MRLTIRTSLALRTLMFCATRPGTLVRKADVAAAFCASENHLAQVIHTLGVMGYIDTQRGRSGGMMLARPMATITAGAVIRDFEGGFPFDDCYEGAANPCAIADCCYLRNALVAAIEAFYQVLDKVTLADLIQDNQQLEHLFALGAQDGRPGCSARIRQERACA